MKKKFLFYYTTAITSVLFINSLLLYALFKSTIIDLNIPNYEVTLNKVSYMMIVIGIFLIFYSLFFVFFIIDRILFPIYKKNYDIDKLKSKGIKNLLPVEMSILEQYDFHEQEKEKFQKEKRQIEIVMQNMSEGLIIIDNDQKIIFLNSNAKHLLNSQEGEYEKKIFLELSRNKHYIEAVKTALNGKTYEKIINLKKRKIRIFSNPVYYKKEIIAIFLLISDKTEEYERNKHKTQFTANVSHELKTPLTSILGYADLISQNFAQGEDIKKFADKISKQSYILLDMINDIIKLSNIEDLNNFEKEDINLSQIVKDSISNHIIQCKEKNVSLLSDIPDDVKLYANEKMIIDLVNNLINNAIKYNKENGKVIVSVDQDDTHTIFQVEDTGIGIPEKKQERVFERFYTVDKSHSKKNGGTGLGLSIVKHIAIAHGAEIDLKSTSGVGSIFTVKFNSNKKTTTQNKTKNQEIENV